jgi:hypothetical protein
LTRKAQEYSMMTQPTSSQNHVHLIAPDVLAELTADYLLQLKPGERPWKLYVFRPVTGRATHLEHHIYTKLKADGRLALVTFAVHTPNGGQPVRSGIARVPDLTAGDLEQIIAAIRRQTQAGPDEYEEVNLSDCGL